MKKDFSCSDKVKIMALYRKSLYFFIVTLEVVGFNNHFEIKNGDYLSVLQ